MKKNTINKKKVCKYESIKYVININIIYTFVEINILVKLLIIFFNK